MVEERWMAKLPRNRLADNRVQPFVNLRNHARVNQFDVVNFDLRAAFYLNALIHCDFRVLFGDEGPVVALNPSCPNIGGLILT